MCGLHSSCQECCCYLLHGCASLPEATISSKRWHSTLLTHLCHQQRAGMGPGDVLCHHPALILLHQLMLKEGLGDVCTDVLLQGPPRWVYCVHEIQHQLHPVALWPTIFFCVHSATTMMDG